MNNIKQFVRIYKINFAILLFLILFGAIHYFKPDFLYNKEGGFRPFGIGYRHKTVVPIWIVAIFLSILSYLAILTYLMHF